jgi:hypothetical protein
MKNKNKKNNNDKSNLSNCPVKETKFISWLCGETNEFPFFKDIKPINLKVKGIKQ